MCRYSLLYSARRFYRYFPTYNAACIARPNRAFGAGFQVPETFSTNSGRLGVGLQWRRDVPSPGNGRGVDTLGLGGILEEWTTSWVRPVERGTDVFPLSPHTKGEPMAKAEKPGRSKTVNNLSLLAGLATAGVGFGYVFRHAARTIDIVLIVAGLLVAGMALYLRMKRQL